MRKEKEIDKKRQMIGKLTENEIIDTLFYAYYKTRRKCNLRDFFIQKLKNA